MAELACLSQLVYRCAREPRYLKAAVLLYSHSLVDRAQARRLRHGFCALSLCGSLLDGDQERQVAPIEEVRQLLVRLASGELSGGDGSGLLALARGCLEGLGEEARGEFRGAVQAILADRERRLAGREVAEPELRAQRKSAFRHAFNVAFIALRSARRADDVSEMLELLGWCGTLKELEEGVDQGRILLPGEALPEDALETDARRILELREARNWLRSENEKARMLFLVSQAKIEALGKQPGARMLKVIHRSTKKRLLAPGA